MAASSRLLRRTRLLLLGALLLPVAAGSSSSVDALLEGVADEDEEVAARSLKALTSWGPHAAPALRRALATAERVEVRRAAARALGHLGAPVARLAVSELTAAVLREEEAGVRHLAAAALGSVHPGAPGLLAGGLLSPDRAVRKRAAFGIGVMHGSTNGPFLVWVLRHDPDLRVRAFAASFLGIARPAGLGTRALLDALPCEDEGLAQSALQGLGHQPRPDAIPVLLRCARDPRAPVRAAAVWALGRSRDASCFAALREAARDPEWSVRGSAVGALGELGPVAVAALPELMAALEPAPDDAQEWAAHAAATALARLGPPAAPAAGRLRALLRDAARPYARRSAVYALHAVGVGDPLTVDALEGALGDHDPLVRGAAAQALVALDPARRGDPFLLVSAVLRSRAPECVALAALLAVVHLAARRAARHPLGRGARAGLCAGAALLPALALGGAAHHELRQGWIDPLVPTTVATLLPARTAAVASIGLCCALLAVWSCQRRDEGR